MTAHPEPLAFGAPFALPVPDLAALARDLNAGAPQDPADRLRAIRAALPGRIVLTTAFGLETQLMIHLIAREGLGFDLVTLDTGRLFPETHEVWAETERRYGVKIRAILPEARAV